LMMFLVFFNFFCARSFFFCLKPFQSILLTCNPFTRIRLTRVLKMVRYELCFFTGGQGRVVFLGMNPTDPARCPPLIDII
jgi:hypothetical protein